MLSPNNSGWAQSVQHCTAYTPHHPTVQLLLYGKLLHTAAAHVAAAASPLITHRKLKDTFKNKLLSSKK